MAEAQAVQIGNPNRRIQMDSPRFLVLRCGPEKSCTTKSMSYAKKLRNLWDMEKYSDLSIDVELNNVRIIFKVHKLILSLASEVFETLFYESDPPIENKWKILDTNPVVFDKLLCYIYKRSIILDSFELAADLYYVAGKYDLDDLVNVCRNYLISIMNRNRILRSYDFALFYGDEMLENETLRRLQTNDNFPSLLFTRDFYELQPHLIATLFKKPGLGVSEIALVEALSRYADYHGATGLYDPEEEHPTGVFLIMRSLRFLNLRESEFIDCEIRKRFICNLDAFAILSNIIAIRLLSDFPVSPMPNGLEIQFGDRTYY